MQFFPNYRITLTCHLAYDGFLYSFWKQVSTVHPPQFPQTHSFPKTFPDKRLTVVYYESIKQELNRRLIYECRCDERLKAKAKGSTRLGYTGLCGGLEHLLSVPPEVLSFKMFEIVTRKHPTIFLNMLKMFSKLKTFF